MNDLFIGHNYIQKFTNNIYVIVDFCDMFCPSTGILIKGVIYKHIDNSFGVLVRSIEQFKERFEEIDNIIEL